MRKSLVLDSRGHNFALEATAYSGASWTSRELANWQPFPGSADSDLLPELGTLVSRTRDLTRNNGIASGAVETLLDNIVGTGLRLSSTPDWRWLGKTPEWAEEWSTQVEGEWRSFAETMSLDAADSLTFHGMTRQVLRASITNGEALALVLWLPDAKSRYRYSTKLQLIEADRLSNPQGKFDSANHRGGIDIDAYGKPLAYHIQRAHPGDAAFMFSDPKDYTWERVKAETDWGRKLVLHVHDRERSGQTRGKPLFSSVLTEFRMLDGYIRTELQAAIVNAMIAAFVETPMGMEQVAALFGGDVESEKYKQWVTSKNEHMATLKGAAVIPLNPGEKLSPFTPARPATAFAEFCEEITRQIGNGLNLPYELVAKNFSKTNYSSARAALLEAWRFFWSRRVWLSNYWANPVYELWLEEAINKGVIDAPGFYGNRYAYCRCKWIGPGRGWIDPVKEVEAAMKRMQSMISTLEQECAEQGFDWEEVLEQKKREMMRIEELGLNALIAPTPAGGALPAPPNPQPQEEPEEQPAR